MYIDGHELRRLFMGGVDWLSRHVDTINNLNVFPVPDGDTGTNMLLTVKKAQSFIENLGDDHIGRLSESLATGARYGARLLLSLHRENVWNERACRPNSR